MILGWLFRLLAWPSEREFVRGVNASFAAMERTAETFGSKCPICNGTDVFLCPDCLQPINRHSHEQDYECDCTPDGEDNVESSHQHGTWHFVHPIRKSDGKRVIGDGRPRSDVRVMEDAEDLR